MASPHSDGSCSPEEKMVASEASARGNVESASSPICSLAGASTTAAPKVEPTMRAANCSSRSECAATSLPVCSLARACAGGLKSKKVICQKGLDIVAKSWAKLRDPLNASFVTVLPAVYKE